MRTTLPLRAWLVIGAIALVFLSSQAHGQGVLVSGTVTDHFGRPVPGVAVSLIHQQFGRSPPAFTDGFGQYSLWNIPPSPLPYFIEVYWGNQLIYRQQLVVAGPLVWHIRVQ